MDLLCNEDWKLGFQENLDCRLVSLNLYCSSCAYAIYTLTFLKDYSSDDFGVFLCILFYSQVVCWTLNTRHVLCRAFSHNDFLMKNMYLVTINPTYASNITFNFNAVLGITLIGGLGGLESRVSKWKMWTFSELHRRAGWWAAQKGGPACSGKGLGGLQKRAALQPTHFCSPP